MDVTRPEDQPGYEFKPEEYESPGMQRTQEELTLRAIELLEMTTGKVLDIGCGTGYSTAVLHEQGFSVIGIDSSEEMVEKAKELGVDARVADMHSLPFPDESFDAIISISTIQWSQDPKSLAREFQRVLRKGGKVVAQFYPANEKDAIAVAKAFAANGFTGGLQVDNPGSPRKKKFFLVMKRQ